MLSSCSRHGVLDPARQRAQTAERVRELDVRLRGPGQPVRRGQSHQHQRAEKNPLHVVHQHLVGEQRRADEDRSDRAEQGVGQVTGRVRWRESVLAMQDAGVERFVELGGKVLSPMITRTAPDAATTSVASMADIEALLTAL